MKKLYAIAACSLCLAGFGQSNQNFNTLPNITRPSPTVAQLMKVEESTLDHYTGQPQISVPLFSTKAGNLDVGLTLSYNSSGIRVNEQSGWVGKGWSLEAGGVISRSVVDLPDEIEAPLLKGTNQSDNYYHDFFNFAPDSEQRKSFTYDAQWGARIDIDSKNDIYQFNFFGRTGRFVFTKIGGILKPAIIGNDGNYKIEEGYTTNPLPTMYPKEITSFIITDGMGYRYYFTEIERTEKKDITFVYSQEGCDNPVAPSEPTNIGKFISAWHLSKVEDSNGIRILDIAYTSVFEKPMAPTSSTEYIAKDLHLIFSASYPLCTQSMKCALKPRMITSKPYREILTKKISRISFPDGSSIRFSISGQHPEYRDAAGAYLTNIEIYNAQDGAAVRTFNFNYSSGPPLYLDSVKTNNSDTDRYAFEYYKREIYPGFDTPSRDIFGYASFEPAYDAARTGVLTKISYPTKGVREFEWEPNTYSYKGDRLLTFQEIFNNPDNFTTHPEGINDPFINAGTTRPYGIFDVNVEQDAFVHSSTSYSGNEPFTIPNSIMIVPIMSATDQTRDPNRPDAGYPIGTNESINRTIHLKKGAYKVYFWSLNLPVHTNDKIRGDIVINVKNPKPHLNWFLYGGGLRINGIKDKDRDIDQVVKGFAYNFENPGIIPPDLPFYPYQGTGYTMTFSSGSFDGSDKLVRDYIVSIAPIYNIPGQVDNAVEYHVYEKQSELDVQLQKGSLIGYKNVFEYSYPNSSSISAPLFRSKIKYVFDSPIDFPSDITVSSPALPIRGDEYKQSNVRKIEYFGLGTGMVVSEDFKYNYDLGNIKTFVKKNVYFLSNENSLSGFCQQVRTLYTSYANLKNNLITAFQYATDCTGQPSALAQSFQAEDKTACVEQLSSIYSYMSIDDYRYRTQVVERTKKEYFPAGPVETKETFTYRDESKQLAAQASMSSTGQVLETRYYYPQDAEMPPASTPYKAELIARNMRDITLRTENYKNGNQISVQEIRYGLFTLPQDTSNPTPPGSPSTLLPQYIYAGKENVPQMEKKLTFDSYDSRANITQYTQDSGVPVSFVWGYKNSQPLAKIDNMAYGALPAGLVTAARNKSDAIGVSYNEADLLVALDNLRAEISASRALMTGYTYRPLFGITATVAPNGDVTRYKYDQFGRLETVKDKEGNVLSHNKYQYRTQN